ncbi:hypothetical protein D3C72_1856160 [compost metagenome]
MISPWSPDSPFLIRKKLIKSGVIIIPIIPEIEALKIADVTFPFAMETIKTDDETVEGKQAKKKTDSQIL